MKILTVIIYLIGATSMYVHQFLPCETPNLDPYDTGYDCLSRRVYFMQEAIAGASLGMMWLVYKFSKPAGLFKSFQIGMLSFAIGGMIDVLFLIPNNIYTLVGFTIFLISMIYGIFET